MHSKGKVEQSGGNGIHIKSECIALTYGENRKANAVHISALWNAAEGMTTEEAVKYITHGREMADLIAEIEKRGAKTEPGPEEAALDRERQLIKERYYDSRGHMFHDSLFTLMDMRETLEREHWRVKGAITYVQRDYRCTREKATALIEWAMRILKTR